MKTIKIIGLSLILFLSFSCLPTHTITITKAETENPLKIEKIIGLSQDLGTFRNGHGLAVAKDGTIFIGDTGESQIEVFDANFKYLRTIGSLGNGEEQFQYIQNIHLDKEENLYVLDRFLGCIKVFSKEGKFIRKIGEKGILSNQLNLPIDFCFLNTGNLLILDFDVKVFTKEGQFITNFLKEDSGELKIFIKEKLAIDKDGFVYLVCIIDSLEYRFFKFNPDGTFIGQFLVDGKYKDRYKNGPFCLSIIGSNLFISNGHSIQKYKISNIPAEPASFVETIEGDSIGSKIGKTTIVESSTLFSNEKRIYYLDRSLNRLIVLSYNKEFLSSIESSIKEYGFLYKEKEIQKNIFSEPHGLLIGPDNNFYVVNTLLNKISIYNTKWKEINSFGKPVKGRKKQLGELMNPIDIAINQDGFVFVSDCNNEFDDQFGSIEVFTKDFQPFMSIPIPNGIPMGISINSQGNLVVSIRFDDSINIYDLSKITEKKISKKKSIDIFGFYLDDLVVDDKDNMILSFWLSCMVQWIDPNGEKYQEISGDYRTEKMILNFPSGICLDRVGNLYIAEPGNGRIQKFSSNLELIWQSELCWNGISYLTMDSQGKIYATDKTHNVTLVISDSTAVPPIDEDPTSNTEFSLSVDKPFITEQDEFTLFVNVDKLEHVSSLDLTIQYPDKLLSLESCEIGNLLTDQSFEAPKIEQSTGFFNITSKSNVNNEAKGTGELFKIQLKAKRPGLAYLEFADIKLLNAEGKKVSFASKQGHSIIIQAIDSTPPPLRLQPIPEVVYEPMLLIEGVTEAGAKVTINQQELPVNSDGTFEHKLELTKGVNTILVVATDKVGNQTKQTLSTTLKDKIVIELTIGSNRMITNGKPIQLDVSPYIDKISGRTMVPIRAISGAIGARIDFSQDARIISITLGTTSVELRIGNPKAIVNGKEVPIDSNDKVTPVIVGGRTFVPLRFVAENFNFKVEWDPKTQKIVLTYPHSVS